MSTTLINTVKRKVLFLCSGNAARSQMAEALLRDKAGDLFEVYSAGTNPEPIDNRTITTLINFGLATDNLMSKDIKNFENKHFDYIITLCDKAAQQCRIHPWFSNQANSNAMEWHFPDPKSRNIADPFAVTLHEINSRLSMFLLVESKKPTITAQTEKGQVQKKTSLSNKELTLDPIAFYKCLTDEIRLKSIMLVQYHGELCVCELMAALQEQSQPKISRNLALLRKAKILIDRKHGQWVFYKLNPNLPAWVNIVLAQTTENNVNYIAENLQKLTLMNNRPDKTKFCYA